MTSRFTEIGRLGRARALDGWVRFLPNNHFDVEYFQTNSVVYIKNERSGFRPLRIESYYDEVKNNQQTFFVKFDMITNRTEAEAVKDKSVFTDQFSPEDEAEEEVTETDEFDLIGYEVVYEDEIIGTVLDLMPNPAHYILQIKFRNEVLLVPFVDEYVIQSDHQNRTITCRNLDQLSES